MTKRIIYLLIAGLPILIGCAPQEYVVQHAEKGNFSHLYKHLGVYCDRANVYIHGWSNDSVSIAVTMDAKVKNDFSFLVDSSGDSLLLIGKRGVASETTINSIPNIDIAAPYNTAAVLRTNGSIIIDSISGNIDATGTDTMTYRVSQILSPVNLSATDGRVLLYLPASAAYNIDFECGQNAQIQINKQDFRGENRGNRAKGTVGIGGMLLKARGEKGISCF